MDYSTSLQASFWVMVLLQTLGSVDMPGSGQRKMPAPRAYLSVIVAWAVLQILADTGGGRDRAAAAAGWVITLAGLVVGPFGTKLVGLFNSVATISSPTTSNES